jgi:hypothetical protein
VVSTSAECTDLAFRSNALVIHYVTNDHLVQPDEMVLFDGGCEYKFREHYVQALDSCTDRAVVDMRQT